MRVEGVSSQTFVQSLGASFENTPSSRGVFQSSGSELADRISAMAKRGLEARKIIVSPGRAIKLFYKALQKVMFDELA